MIKRRLFLLGCAALLTACSSVAKLPEADAVYYLVRHAEKTTEKKDPSLTVAGQKRAADLAIRLSNIPITKIYSSNYNRTRNTAMPIAKAKNLSLEIYDPRALDIFSKNLLIEKGHILVVGHSNTTPNLAAFLGGDAGDPIVEATEYNRLYVVTRHGDEITSRIERYGD